MVYIEAIDNPDKYSLPENKLFLAGGITNCPDWQKNATRLLQNENIAIFNPRRKKAPEGESSAVEQITWEFHCFENSNMAVFWFSRGSINPIVLYELGKWVNSKYYNIKDVFIGFDKGYTRKLDVIVQTRLAYPNYNVPFYNSIEEICVAVKSRIQEIKNSSGYMRFQSDVVIDDGVNVF